MKSYYRECQKCGNLMPYLTYFLGKEENAKLTEEDRKLCFQCYLDKYPKRHPKLLEDFHKLKR